jgi:hypothetical protein
MNNTQVGLRLDPVLATRIQVMSKKTGMTVPAVVLACVDFYLPVIEAGLHGNPVGEPLLAQWAADLEEARGRLAAASASPTRSARRPTKAA